MANQIEEPTLFDEWEYDWDSEVPIVAEDTEKEDNNNDDKKLNNSNIIKNISYDQTEILYNIGKLYNNGSPQFDADMTASTLGFYGKGRGKYIIPEPKILMDVFPTREDIKKIDKWGKLPLEDNSIHSLVIDLPFVISPANAPSVTNKKDNTNLIYNRFNGYYPADNLYFSYYHWLSEAYRVLDNGGICIFKCQTCISGGIRHNIEEFSFMTAQRLGFKMEDKFTLLAKARLISSNRYKNGQKHSRSYTSQFLVLIKDNKKKSKDFFFEDLLNKCESEEIENYKNIVEK